MTGRDDTPLGYATATALLADTTSLDYLTALVTGTLPYRAPDDEGELIAGPAYEPTRAEADESRTLNANLLATALGYRPNGYAASREPAAVRAFLRDLGRRLRRCELIPDNLGANLRTDRQHLEAVVTLAGHLTRLAAHDQNAHRDAAIAKALSRIALFPGENWSQEVEHFPAETTERAAARSLLTLAGALGYVREPTTGSYIDYDFDDARDAGHYLLALQHVIACNDPSRSGRQDPAPTIDLTS
jgi:hypothetical protein